MYAQTGWMVSLWLLPVVLFIGVPLATLLCWGVHRVFKKAGEKSRALYEAQEESTREKAHTNMESTATA